MKKLTLNKQTIARLNNPDKILGGQPPRSQPNGRCLDEVCKDETGYATNGYAQCATENGHSWCYCPCNTP